MHWHPFLRVHYLEELVLLFKDEIIESLAAALFHSFEAELEIDRNGNVVLDVRLQSVDPTDDWSFVIRSTTSE